MSNRIIAIWHRIKRTKEGANSPTLAVISDGKETIKREFETEQQEYDFVTGCFPLEYRKATEEDDLSGFPEHLVQFKAAKAEEAASHPQNLLRKAGSKWEVATKVPSSYEGLKAGDLVLMPMGGSGDTLAYAIAQSGIGKGISVARVSLHAAAKLVGKIEQDPAELIALYGQKPDLFFPVTQRDASLIYVREAFRNWERIMKDRIACEQRINQSAMSSIYCAQEGLYPQGNIEKMSERIIANDSILLEILKKEAETKKKLAKALESLDAYNELFEPIQGVGPAIAGRIIASVQDVRLFPRENQFKKFFGVHVLPDGTHPRKRRGVACDWNPTVRQAMFLLGDQFNRRPDSRWGKELRRQKQLLRKKHPEPVKSESGAAKYTDMHIHRMATWRTLTKFVEWLYREWRAIEKRHQAAIAKVA